MTSTEREALQVDTVAINEMAKSLSLQLREALSARDTIESQLAGLADERQELTLRAEALASDLQAANQLSETLKTQVAELTTRNEELAHDNAIATEELLALRAQSQTVTEAAAEQAATIVADIGVPAVDADTHPGAGKSIADMTAEYAELLKADTRAAGEFYTNKLAPALKETK